MADKESFPLRRLLGASNPVELHAAARDLSRIRDGDIHTISHYLNKSEKIAREYEKANAPKR